MKNKCVAVIPARGGSKRIYKKNIKDFLGIPIICRVIEKIASFDMFDKIIVSTDDQEICEVVARYSDIIVVTRPEELSDDYTTTVAVVSHAIENINDLGVFPEYVCCIYPCSVFLQKQDLQDGMELLKNKSIDFTYPIAEYPHPIQRAVMIDKNRLVKMNEPEYELIRTQDLRKMFHDVGQFYWGYTKSWLTNKKMHSSAAGVVVPSWRYVDIDTEDDWIRAERYFKCYG
jgi:pseudaminic acid cytidylyltransferase